MAGNLGGLRTSGPPSVGTSEVKAKWGRFKTRKSNQVKASCMGCLLCKPRIAGAISGPLGFATAPSQNAAHERAGGAERHVARRLLVRY